MNVLITKEMIIYEIDVLFLRKNSTEFIFNKFPYVFHRNRCTNGRMIIKWWIILQKVLVSFMRQFPKHE